MCYQQNQFMEQKQHKSDLNQQYSKALKFKPHQSLKNKQYKQKRFNPQKQIDSLQNKYIQNQKIEQQLQDELETAQRTYITDWREQQGNISPSNFQFPSFSNSSPKQKRLPLKNGSPSMLSPIAPAHILVQPSLLSPFEHAQPVVDPKPELAAVQPAPRTQNKKQCLICMQSFHKDKLYNLAIQMGQCENEKQHKFCKSCYSQYLKNIVNQYGEVGCPGGCPIKSMKDNINGTGESDNQGILKKMKFFLTQKQVQKYQKGQFIRMCQRDNLKRCPNQKCQFSILIEYFSIALQKQISQCSKCLKQFCLNCSWPAHKGDCNKAADAFIENNLLFASCPGCKRNIQRNQGCPHMTCVCGYQFCYLCLGRWSSDHLCESNRRRIKIERLGALNGQNNRMTESRIQIIDRQVQTIFQQEQRRISIQRQRQQRRQQERRIYRQNQLRRIQQYQQQNRQLQLIYQQRLRRRRLEEMRVIQQQRRRRQEEYEGNKEKSLQVMLQFKKKNKNWRNDDQQFIAQLKKVQKTQDPPIPNPIPNPLRPPMAQYQPRSLNSTYNPGVSRPEIPLSQTQARPEHAMGPSTQTHNQNYSKKINQTISLNVASILKQKGDNYAKVEIESQEKERKEKRQRIIKRRWDIPNRIFMSSQKFL